MPSIRKYMFDMSFDPDLVPEPEPEPAAPPEPEPPPPPTFSEEELAAARAEAFAEGREAGRAEAEAATERRLAEALERVADRVDRLVAAHAEAQSRESDAAIAVALALVRKLFPELARRGALPEVEAVVSACLADLAEEPRVVVRVADDLLAAVNERIDALAAERGFHGRIAVMAESGLAPGDCRIEWTDGGAERDAARLWEEIERIAALHAPALALTDTPHTERP